MRSLEKIFALMESNGTPFWRLKLQEGRSWVDCGIHNGKNDDAGSAAKKSDRDLGLELESSQTKLEKICLDNDDDGRTIFSIELLVAPNSHGSGRFGPFQFTVDGSDQVSGSGRERSHDRSGGDSLRNFLPNGLGDILALDRSHGSMQMQMQLHQADRMALEREKEAFREEKANWRADAKEKAAEYKETAISEAKREIAHLKQLHDLEKIQFENLKEQWKQQKESDGETWAKGKEVLGFVFDYAQKKIMGADAPANALGSTKSDDEHWDLCEQIAQEVYTVGDINFTNEVIKFYKQLLERKNTSQ